MKYIALIFALIVDIAMIKAHKVNRQITQLENDGYCREWAEKIALTEQGLIKPDSVYFNMIND